ncbi:MAG: GTP 3',8-cyclase MoaA [Nitrospirota bacterium]
MVQLIDGFSRRIDYIRVSITDRCNLRCLYCMPKEGMPFKERSELLTFEEIERVVNAFVMAGVSRVRITGGEPLVRKGLPDLVRAVSRLDGVKDLSMTTNAGLLERFAKDLKRAGLRRINISLDSLRHDRFREITRGGELSTVLSGIDKALDVGLIPVKINMVVMRGVNDDELVEFVKFAAKRHIKLRFIECMPLGRIGFLNKEMYMPSEEIAENIAREYPLSPSGGDGAGPARYYRAEDLGIDLGFISPISQHFCSTCNRVRVTAVGKLRLCLGHDEEIDLRSILRSGINEEELLSVILDGIRKKPKGHNFVELSGNVCGEGMSSVGG